MEHLHHIIASIHTNPPDNNTRWFLATLLLAIAAYYCRHTPTLAQLSQLSVIIGSIITSYHGILKIRRDRRR